jgi:rare lipoprotein A
MIDNIEAQLKNEIHEASYYSEDFHGLNTANGEVFDMNAITAAHRTLPFNTLVKVTNHDNGKSVVVRINDRGPYAHTEVRHMDLSLAAMELIGKRSQGVLRNVSFERLGDADLYDPNAIEAKEEEGVKEEEEEEEEVKLEEQVSSTSATATTSATFSETTIWKQLFAKSMLPRRGELLSILKTRR